jgi:hypothetical protein
MCPDAPRESASANPNNAVPLKDQFSKFWQLIVQQLGLRWMTRKHKKRKNEGKLEWGEVVPAVSVAVSVTVYANEAYEHNRGDEEGIIG